MRAADLRTMSPERVSVTREVIWLPPRLIPVPNKEYLVCALTGAFRRASAENPQHALAHSGRLC